MSLPELRAATIANIAMAVTDTVVVLLGREGARGVRYKVRDAQP